MMEHTADVGFLYMIPLIPFISAAFIGLLARRLNRGVVSVLACLSVLASFCYSLRAFAALMSSETPHSILTDHLWTWFNSTSLSLGVDLMVDPLSAVMILVVSGVGFLIHVYSVGYMSHDDESNRYFSHLNLFVAFMLVLVLGKNIPMMFVGWEGVGACSYLLIGFYFRDWDKASAGKKAFIFNRIGDKFFVIGVLALVVCLEKVHAPAASPDNNIPVALDFIEIQQSSEAIAALPPVNLPLLNVEVAAVSFICFCLFVGATGKSAQIPLYVWLPDAMAGPTPVSALIHAATMVTAGVYMVCRLSSLYMHSGWVLTVIAYTGATTALFAGIIATKQRDIKKILAYSTISQLGYMFLACGVRAYSHAVFHLFTHAFFKALLFLGAGSVIHALHGEQDIFKMGGLKKKLPATYVTFLVGAFALSGIPPLAGFFSKDGILWAAYQSPHGGGPILYIMGLLTAGLTAFYMFRLVALVFWSESRLDMSKKERKTIHESPDSMTFPLWVLAFMTICTGFLNIPAGLTSLFGSHGEQKGHGITEMFSQSLHHTFGAAEASLGDSHALELILMLFTVSIATIAIVMAKGLYSDPDWQEQIDRYSEYWPQSIRDFVENKFYIDEIYDLVVVRPMLALSRFLKTWVDERSIDGVIIHGSASMTRAMARGLATIQNGDAQRYLIALALGVLWAVFFLTRKVGI